MDVAEPGIFDSKRFRQVLGHFPTGVVAVTAVDTEGQAVGMAVGSFTSVSLDPPLVGFLPDKTSSSFPRIRSAESFCINVLAHDQEHVCRALAARGPDKLRDVPWRPSPSGAPLIDGVVAWIDCELETVHEAGDHYIAIGRVRDLDTAGADLPLLFFQGGYGRFAQLSLTAQPETDILEQLTLVDVIRPHMAELATQLGVECLAATVVGDEIVILGSAGQSRHGVGPSRIGQRIPFVPPLNAIWVAWAAEDAVERWISRAFEPGDPGRAELHARLERVRQRGWSLGLGTEEHRMLEAALARTPAAAHEPVGKQDARGLVDRLAGKYEPSDLEPGRSYDVRNLTAPVFDADGQVVLTLTVYGLPSQSTREAVDRYSTHLLAATAAATDAIGGVRPGGTR
jgi:flavin reductase (DIM6/NTAB) family NADH-FMN oxidoreductase RutF/DNA-binding IclR family transcriptional regulator